MENFRTYDLAVAFYHEVKNIKLPMHLRCQLDRAASSISLNLAEGYGRKSIKEQRHFFQISFGSLKECQAILQLADSTCAFATADKLGAHLYKLIQSARLNC